MADAFCMTCADRLYLQLQEITPRCPGESSPVLSYASAVTTQLQTVPALQNCNVNRWGRGKKLDGKDLPSAFECWNILKFDSDVSAGVEAAAWRGERTVQEAVQSP